MILSENINRRLRILILDQGRQALPFLKSLTQKGHDVIIVCNSKFSEGYFSRYPARRLIWPSYIEDRKVFEYHLINYLKQNEIDVTISVGDISSEILSLNKKKITLYTNVTNPDYSVFIRAADKLNLMNYCMLNNLPCPITNALNENLLDSIENIYSFPVIVKPTRGVGAIGVRKFNSGSDLKKEYPHLRHKYKNLIIQEYIPRTKDGKQYQAEVFLDNESKMKTCLVIEKPRYFPVSGGTSTANVTIFHEEIKDISKSLLEGLKWRGAADIDYVLDPRDNKIKILEINPRVTAGIKIGFAAGIDFADLHIKLALGEEVPSIENYKTGVYCRNLFLETLWFLYSDVKMKRNTSPSFLKFFGKNIVYQLFSIDDPLPPIGFFFGMIKKYSNPKRFKSKFRR